MVVRKMDPNALGRKQWARLHRHFVLLHFSASEKGDEMKMHSAPLKLEERLPAHGMKR